MSQRAVVVALLVFVLLSAATVANPLLEDNGELNPIEILALERVCWRLSSKHFWQKNLEKVC
jgi:hypothetical protein